MRRALRLALLLLLAAPAAALEVTAVSPREVKGAPRADFTFGPLTVKAVAWRDGAVVLPVTENKGRQYIDIRLLSKALYLRVEKCFREGFSRPARAPARPSLRIESLKPLKSQSRVANAELSFDGELLVTAGVMASRREEGAFWVAFPPALAFTDNSFKSAVESAVIAAWAKKNK